jgi:hypothetical protein
MECSDEGKRSNLRTRISVPSRELAENHIQHAIAAAEVTRNRNQKAQSAEEGGGQSRVHEINDDDFPVKVRPAASNNNPQLRL